jgi:hypothetical protein
VADNTIGCALGAVIAVDPAARQLCLRPTQDAVATLLKAFCM